MSESKRPDYVTDEHLTFLDELRKKGEVNMFLAHINLWDAFNLDKETAIFLAVYWQDTFGSETR